MKFFDKICSFIRNDNPDARIKWSLYGRVWREFGLPYWKWLTAGIICTIIAAGAEAYSITLIKKVIDLGFIEKNMGSLYIIGFQVIAIFTVKGIFSYAKTLSMSKAGLLGATNLRRRIYRHLIKQPIGFFHTSQTGILMNYFTGLSGAVLNLVTGSVISIIQSTVTILMMIGLMLWYAPQLIIILLFLTPAILIPVILITRKRRIVSRNSFSADASSLTHISQSIEGIKTIQAFCCEDIASENMNKIEDYRAKMGFKSARLSGIESPLLEFMISLGLCLALIVGGHFITKGSITTGDFIAFILALTAAYKPAKTITGVNGGIQTGLIAAEGLFDFLDQKSEITDAPDAITLHAGPMHVQLNKLTFAYNRLDGNVLQDISLDIAPGKICAFVGLSGGGKSTIFNLLERFYDPQQGGVIINGKDIRKYTLMSLRENIATVSQDVFLFSGTFAENIKYANPNATMEQIEAAAKAANAHDFIMDFPLQYNNHVGERGALLSGGQKQRIAIARAILKDAPILLLDEATSALDSQSEKLIQAALKKLMLGRTTFVIAHRLATVLDADMICVVKDGQIVEQGTDAELTILNGEYKKLKDIQFNEQEN